jgi:glycosyltransferase involved in cell wall biosynthesis
MKILQINNNHYRKSGTDSVYLNTIDLLRNHNHKVIAFSFLDENNLNEKSSNYFVHKNLFNKSVGKFYSTSAKKSIEQLIKEQKPDIAHFHNIIGGLSSSILPVLKKYNIPTVATFHGFKYLCPAYVFINGKGEICEDCKVGKYYNCIKNNCAPEGLLKSSGLAIESYLRDFFFPFNKYIDKYIFLSKFFWDKYNEFYPEILSKSTFFYNFLSDIKNVIEKSKGNYFLYFGRLDREKGIKTLINAFTKNPEVQLKIIGKGQYSDYLINNKIKNVEYLGFKNWDEIKDYLINASFVIVPSECYENNPMTIIESYSLGTPVIGANIGGIPEIILPGETGYLFDSKNVDQLADTIQIANQLEEVSYNKMSQNSFKFAQENFSSENYYSKLIAVYNSLMN